MEVAVGTRCGLATVEGYSHGLTGIAGEVYREIVTSVANVVEDICRARVVPLAQNSPCGHIVGRDEDNKSGVCIRNIRGRGCVVAVVSGNGGIEIQDEVIAESDTGGYQPVFVGRVNIHFPVVCSQAGRRISPTAIRRINGGSTI